MTSLIMHEDDQKGFILIDEDSQTLSKVQVTGNSTMELICTKQFQKGQLSTGMREMLGQEAVSVHDQ